MKYPGWVRIIFERIGSYVLWLFLAVLVTLVLFQVHATITSLALAGVENPATRPAGWSTNTIYAFSRMMWLVVGIVWLGWVMYTLDYLREGQKYHLLRKRLVRLMVILGVVYLTCYLVLLIMV